MKSTYRELVRQGFGFTNLNYTAVFSYDAAGRLVREGNRTYRYGYLDKVLSVTDGKRSYRYAYHVDGQLARADYGDGGRAGVGEDGRAGSPLPTVGRIRHLLPRRDIRLQKRLRDKLVDDALLPDKPVLLADVSAG